MTVKNAYPELKEVPFVKTQIDEQLVIAYIAAMPILREIKRAAYIFFCNESAHGKAGVNDNYGGIQADGSRWNKMFDTMIVATTVTPENMTGDERRFCVFDKWQSSIYMLVYKVQQRGIFIGGYAHPYALMEPHNPADFAKAYWDEWVKGDSSTPPTGEVEDIVNQYNKAAQLFK